MYRRISFSVFLLLTSVIGLADDPPATEWITDPWGSLFIVVSQGRSEPMSIGSYSLLVYQNNRDAFITGTVGSRNGTVAGTWFDDLDDDGQPEAVVWIRNAGSGGYGKLQVYTLDQVRLERIVLPEPNFELISDYRGRDKFSMQNGSIYRTFPRYRANDSMAEPTGGEIRLKLDFAGRRWLEATN
jgi:hypothetical protein